MRKNLSCWFELKRYNTGFSDFLIHLTPGWLNFLESASYSYSEGNVFTNFCDKNAVVTNCCDRNAVFRDTREKSLTTVANLF